MDLMTISGVVCGLGVVWFILFVHHMEKFLLNPEAILLIFGGTLGSVLISYPWDTIKRVPLGVKMMLFPPKRPEAIALIRAYVAMAEKARREGLDSLTADVAHVPHPYMEDCLRMVLDGLEAEVIRERCQQDMLATQQRHQQVSGVFRAAGTYAPIFGLLGTLIGVVQVLHLIDTPKAMGSAMGVAMTASFYGIFSANFFFLPVANKLTYYSDEDMLARELIFKGTLCLQAGESPWLIARKLEAYLSFRLRRHGAGKFKAPA